MSAIDHLLEFDARVQRHRLETAPGPMRTSYVVVDSAHCRALRIPPELLPDAEELRAFVDATIERKLPARRAEFVALAKDEAKRTLKELE